jgi:hypothetical protein
VGGPCRPTVTVNSSRSVKTFLLALGSAHKRCKMRMPKRLALSSVLLSSVWLSPLWAQTSPAPTPGGRPYRQPPCWQQAGISQSVMPQIREIQQSTRSQVESVCSNSSLTPQEQRQQIGQLHKQQQQQIEGLVTSEQLQALRSCQEQRGQMGGMHRGGNPCANMPANTAQQPTPAQP